MRPTIKILLKLILIGLFLYMTPFFYGFRNTFTKTNDVLKHFVYKQKAFGDAISIKDQLNVLSYNSNLTLPTEEITVETTQEDPSVIPSTDKSEVPKDPVKPNKNEDPPQKTYSTGKKIYIYNTHQGETYVGGKSVMDAAVILGKKLEERGFKVVLETNNFPKYLAQHNLEYDKSYVASNNYLNDALVNYGGFDLCIDLHRDSIPRSASYLKSDGKLYAKAMMVVGGLGKNAASATTTSKTLSDIINKKKNGIMKSVMTRESYYNQEVHKNILLMELGADVNTFEEVKNTIDFIADGIYDLLGKRGDG